MIHQTGFTPLFEVALLPTAGPVEPEAAWGGTGPEYSPGKLEPLLEQSRSLSRIWRYSSYTLRNSVCCSVDPLMRAYSMWLLSGKMFCNSLHRSKLSCISSHFYKVGKELKNTFLGSLPLCFLRFYFSRKRLLISVSLVCFYLENMALKVWNLCQYYH